MTQEKNKNSVLGQHVDRKALKMRMETLLQVLQTNQDGIKGYLANRPDIAEAVGLNRLLTELDLSEDKIDGYIEDMKTHFTTGGSASVSSRITSHRHLATSLNIKANDDAMSGLPTPIGAGCIGICMTCAAAPRAHLSARYNHVRNGGDASQDPDYDEEFDADPWIDVSSLTLMLPILHWTAKKGGLRPRVSIVCGRCFELATSNTRGYMSRINKMASLVPTKATVIHDRKKKISLKMSSPPTLPEDTLGRKKLLRLCQEIPELKMLVTVKKKTVKHRNKPDEHIHAPALAMAYEQAVVLVRQYASRKGVSLLQLFKDTFSVADPSQEEEE